MIDVSIEENPGFSTTMPGGAMFVSNSRPVSTGGFQKRGQVEGLLQ